MDTLKGNTTLDNFRVRLGTLQHTLDSYFTSKLDSFEFYYNVFTTSAQRAQSVGCALSWPTVSR